MDVHFNNIASGYDNLLPLHIREYLLTKKTRLTVKTLKKYGISKGRGIDLGCGTGWYLKSISEYGYDMTGIDNSIALAEEAKKNNSDNSVVIKESDMLNLRMVTIPSKFLSFIIIDINTDLELYEE